MARRTQHGTHIETVDPAAAELKEIQDHQYTPGYFAGSNLAPHLRQPRPGKIGYVFVFMGVIFLVMAAIAFAATLAAGNPAPVALIGPVALGLLTTASGVSLLRR